MADFVRTPALRTALLLWLAAVPVRAQPKPDLPAPRYNVVLIVVDALRADHLGAYGYPRNTSPHIDKQARDGSIFLNAVTQANWTLPALASIMTSLYPSVHGLVRFPSDMKLFTNKMRAKEAYVPDVGGRLDGSRGTLAAALRDRGYLTAGFVSGGFCRSEFGFDQGFTSYLNFGKKLEELNKRVFEWLERNENKRFFLYIHAGDVHDPYDTTPHYNRLWDPDYRGAVDGKSATLNSISAGRLSLSPRDVKHVLALYDGGVSYTDEHLGRLFDKLKALGLEDDTMIIVTADHGEEFMEHRLHGHGGSAYDPVIKVPLIIRVPGKKPGGRIAAQARSIDIFPTVFDLLGLPLPWPVQGTSLVPLIEGRRAPELVAYTEADRIPSRFAVAVRTRRWKYIRHLEGELHELYDLKKDPRETRNLASAEPKTVKEFEKKYLDWTEEMKAAAARLPALPPDGPLPEHVEDKLRSMGYLK